MAITNYERVGKAMELLREGLHPFVERELQTQYGKYWVTTVTAGWRNELNWSEDSDSPHMDVALILRLMWEQWNEVFRKTLGHAERSLVSELRDHRNKWAHQEPFSTNDAQRVLDSAARLLTAVSAPQADEIERMRMELMRVFFDEQVRNERRKSTGTAIESAATGGLKPWREVVMPHKDVASGRYQQAEFAADLWQVHLGEGTDEYRNPVEFFRRTYLTESLKRLLVGALQRLAGAGGDPVIQLQTNFGGGKTHSMLALYHLASGISPTDLDGIDSVMQEAGTTTLPTARRVVLVGNKISPGNPVVKADGTVVRTLWGELAWQLGGRQAFERVRLDDERATSPGDTLRELFNDYGPCLVLIDEWVAYARQLHDQSDLPAGGFETQFTFAQALTESAKLAKQCLLVISLPASDTTGSPHTQADDSEVGGQRGREALDRLRNVVGRVESSWRPASAEEGFEIVRRRLFEPLADPAQFKDRDVVARAFADMYRSQQQEFPPECHDSEYEKRLKAAYPIHPEIFDRLYTDWSTLIKFQRTRGVLRLMAAVIHSLWEKGDRNPLILPANIPIDQPRVQFELTRYLSDNWVPILEKDVDGPNSLPLRIDSEVPNLGKYAASRRVARTIYLGSAPTATAANRGMEDRRVKLGCVMPGESPAVFGDALRRLAASATYLYQDGPRYWYSTQPTVTKLAEDRAEQLKRDPDKVTIELEQRSAALLDGVDATGAPVLEPLIEAVLDASVTGGVRWVCHAKLTNGALVWADGRDRTPLALAEALSDLPYDGAAPLLIETSAASVTDLFTQVRELLPYAEQVPTIGRLLNAARDLDADPHALWSLAERVLATNSAATAQTAEVVETTVSELAAALAARDLDAAAAAVDLARSGVLIWVALHQSSTWIESYAAYETLRAQVEDVTVALAAARQLTERGDIAAALRRLQGFHVPSLPFAQAQEVLSARIGLLQAQQQADPLNAHATAQQLLILFEQQRRLQESHARTPEPPAELPSQATPVAHSFSPADLPVDEALDSPPIAKGWPSETVEAPDAPQRNGVDKQPIDVAAQPSDANPPEEAASALTGLEDLPIRFRAAAEVGTGSWAAIFAQHPERRHGSGDA